MDALILDKDIGCRSGVTVVRIRFRSNTTGCIVREEFSDGGTETSPSTRVLGECAGT